MYCVLFILGTYSLAAQYSSAQIDSMMLDAIEKLDVAGAAIAVVKDGKIIHNNGYGIKSWATKEKVNEHTQFAIASNSKAFTTTALAILVEEGKITWHDKVIEHIPEFKMYNAYVTENFNIQDLLTHRSGLGLGIGDLMIFPDGTDFKMDDILSSFQHFKPVSAFRTQFDYDNLLYLVAGEIIARKSNMTWEAFIQSHIFEPLNMDNSYPSLAAMRDKSNLSSPHTTTKGKMEELSNYEDMINGAAGGIYSNVDDLAQWMLMHLNKGTYDTQLKDTLFTQKNQNEMWKIHTTTESSRNPGRYDSHFSGYGLGWGLTDKKGTMEVSHTGGLPGMLSRVVMIPDMNLGIAILTNTDMGGAGVFEGVSRTLLDSYLGVDDYQWIEKFVGHFKKKNEEGKAIVDAVWETVKKSKKTKFNTEDYIGNYRDNWFGNVEVFDKNGTLWMRCHRSPKLNGPMQLYKANTFAVKWEYQDMNADIFAMFRLDENGKAQGLKMKGISPDIDFSFDFQDLDLHRTEEE